MPKVITKQPSKSMLSELLVEEFVRLTEAKRNKAKSELKCAYYVACSKLGRDEVDALIGELMRLPF